MFFFLSKAIDFLVMPLSIILILILIGFFVKEEKWKKLAIGLAFLFLYLASSNVLVKKALNWYEPTAKSIKDINSGYDVGILLSGGLTAGTKPYTDAISLGNNGDRVLQAFRLYKAGKIRKILITGTSQDYRMEMKKGETRQAAELLVSWGVKAGDIMFEEKARNTRENAKYSAAILKQRYQNGKYILITSAFHMRRAEGCFNKAGIEVTTFPADYQGGYNEINFNNFIIPDAGAFADFKVLWHEVVGLIVYKLAGYA